jgi:hypothetical protein
MSAMVVTASEGKYQKALSQSQTFWYLTVRAHHETAIFRLCRAYDQDSDALALKGFLETIKAQPNFLPKPKLFHRVDPKQLGEDLAWASFKTNKLVKHLMMWRHKVYSHRDVGKTLSGTMADEFPLREEEVRLLLSRGLDIVNRYNGIFFAAHFAREILALDDYERVLRIVEDQIEVWEARVKAETQQALREAQGDSEPSS